MNSLEYHHQLGGKIEVISRGKIKTREDLSLAYTPGVAEACQEIVKNPSEVYNLTRKHNLVAVVTDGSAVLGLGNIGAAASLPVMEGKCVLFKEFADIDAFPIAIDTQDTEEIIKTVINIAPMFGGINLEDIAAPRCFEIERRLQAELDIPVFHDDQHGTAIVVLAGVYNALKVVGKEISSVRVVINGAGAAGTAVSELILAAGVKNLIVLDSKGIISEERGDLAGEKLALAKVTNRLKLSGDLSIAMKGADVFIGVSKAGLVSAEMVKSMALKPIIFAMANPTPEIMPDLAKAAGAAVIATGRSDYPNQANNVLAFPGVFRGLLDARIKHVTEKMELAAARALADYVKDLSAVKILPDPLDRGVAKAIAEAIKKG